MDKLEKFIIDNRTGLDEQRKPEEGWKELNDRLNEKKTDWGIYWKVAAVIFFACTIVLSAMQFQKGDETGGVIAESQPTLEGYFAQQISLRTQEFQQLATEDQAAELMSDLEKMDAAYAELNESFAELNDPEVAEAMLENLRLRILILNEQIEILRNGAGEEEFYHSS